MVYLDTLCRMFTDSRYLQLLFEGARVQLERELCVTLCCDSVHVLSGTGYTYLYLLPCGLGGTSNMYIHMYTEHSFVLVVLLPFGFGVNVHSF